MKNQYGARKQQSTADAVVKLINNVTKRYDNRS